jgi:hypothetical protein
MTMVLVSAGFAILVISRFDYALQPSNAQPKAAEAVAAEG